MAVEAVVSWYRDLRESELLQTSISDEATAIGRRMMEIEKDLISKKGMMSKAERKAERSAKLAKFKEERKILLDRYVQLDIDLRPMPNLKGMTEAERVEATERLRELELEFARRFLARGDARAPSMEKFARIVDFDPKQEGLYYSRCTDCRLNESNIDEESPIASMRYTNSPYKSKSHYLWLCKAVNFLSVKIASSDVGFPINVYGTVIVRDSADHRCVYHFRRDSDHCQLIHSEAESLILTGPKRGLALCGDIYVEIDLKMKDHLGQQGRDLSKGLVIIRDHSPDSSGYLVQNQSLATRLSTVDLTYTIVDSAVEGTIAIEVLQGGCFLEKITAHTASMPDMQLVLYNSKEVDDAMTVVDDCGDIQLLRHVVSVYDQDLLMIVAKTSDGKSQNIIFTPMINNKDDGLLTVGATKMHVKLFWSVMNP